MRNLVLDSGPKWRKISVSKKEALTVNKTFLAQRENK
jgi:hypothetical protein